MKLPYIILFLLGLNLIQIGTNAQNVITTIAGNGTIGSTGDGGPGPLAELDQPSCVFVDNAGNVYIADQYNNKIRKVAATTGKITTIAGTIASGYNGDTIAATSAQLSLPASVFITKQGYILIADCYNHRIRKIDTTTGMIYTICGTGTSGYSGDGGAAINAKISYPTCVIADTLGNIYFADYGNNCIRMILSTGSITTIAGKGTVGFFGDAGLAINAKLSGPAAICFDHAGNLYIADGGNNRIRTVNTSGIINTFAGNGSFGFSGDGSPAINAEFKIPQSVFADATGNIYVADMGNNRIREINTAGNISTIAGNGTAGYTGEWGSPLSAELNAPIGVFVSNAGNLFIADKANNRVRKIAPSTRVKTVGQTTGIIISPNPNNGKFIVSGMKDTQFSIYNMAGNIIYEGGLRTIVDISTQPNGIYFLAVDNTIQKIVINK